MHRSGDMTQDLPPSSSNDLIRQQGEPELAARLTMARTPISLRSPTIKRPRRLQTARRGGARDLATGRRAERVAATRHQHP
jgi:hypothetical protein